MRLGLLGKSLSHSFSPFLFKRIFEKNGDTEHSYEVFELPNASDIPDFLKANPTLAGMNITIPYKERILEWVDVVSDEVQAVGATNTIKIMNDRIHAYNTDVIGFERVLLASPMQSEQPYLILGTGGASKSVQYVLRKHNIDFQLVSRSQAKGAFTYEDIPHLSQFHTLVNCTPLGMHPNLNSCPNIQYDQLNAEHHLIDLIYNPALTLFLQKGMQRNTKITNGLLMLKEQAQAAWEIWQS